LFADIARLVAGTARRAHTSNVPALAASIAFHALLSLAPLLLLVLTAASSVLGSQEARARLMEAIEALGDPAIVPTLRVTTEMIMDARGNVLANAVGILIMIHFASAVFHELGEALNRIWDVPPRTGLSGLLLPRLIALVLVPAAVAAGMLVMAISFMNALAAPILSELVPPDAPAWTLGRNLGPFLLMTGLLGLLYRYGPRTSVRWSDVRVGAALTALAFTAGNTVLATLLRRNLLASLYGAAGAVVLLLLWIFYSAHLLLIGACFTREYAERFGSRIPGGTRG
jgi:membrane protein